MSKQNKRRNLGGNFNLDIPAENTPLIPSENGPLGV